MSTAAPDDAAKFRLLNELLVELDPGFPEDLRIVTAIIRSKELINTFASPENRRAVYDRLGTVLPGNPYVLQHRSILERDLGDTEMAIKYAREAVTRQPGDQSLRNTLGFALEMSTRTMEESPRRQTALTQAQRIFEDNVRIEPNSPYGYLGQLNVLKQRIERESDPAKRVLLRAESLSLMEDAFEATGQSPLIAQPLATERKQLGDLEQAIKVVNTGLEKKPTDERLRSLLVQFEVQKGNIKEALRIAMEGIKFNPTSWRIQRDIARLRRKLNEPAHAVRGYYDAAIRHNKGDLDLLIELASYLFMSRLYSEAEGVFREANETSAPGHLKSRVREYWKDNGMLKRFEGKIKEIRGGTGTVIAVPENFKAFFWRIDSLGLLRVGDSLSFTVGFNARGPIAQSVTKA